MKILTESKNGVVLELNYEEFGNLKSLVYAVEGRTIDESYQIQYHRDPAYIQEFPDMSSVFGIIEAFYLQKFKVNEMEKYINNMKKALEK